MMKINMIEKYMDFVRPYYENRDKAHDFSHIERIISRLEVLSEGLEEQVNSTFLSFLACFHGLGKKLRDNSTFKQDTINFLKEQGWTAKQIEIGLTAVERHCKAPILAEEKIVHDANYMDLLGALGVAKAFTTGGALGQSFGETLDIYEKDYLDKVEFRTPKGLQLYTEGKKYVKEFTAKLRDELGSV